MSLLMRCKDECCDDSSSSSSSQSSSSSSSSSSSGCACAHCQESVGAGCRYRIVIPSMVAGPGGICSNCASLAGTYIVGNPIVSVDPTDVACYWSIDLSSRGLCPDPPTDVNYLVLRVIPVSPGNQWIATVFFSSTPTLGGDQSVSKWQATSSTHVSCSQWNATSFPGLTGLGCQSLATNAIVTRI